MQTNYADTTPPEFEELEREIRNDDKHIAHRLNMPINLFSAFNAAMSGVNKADFKLAIDYLTAFEKNYKASPVCLDVEKRSDLIFIESITSYYAYRLGIDAIQQSNDWTNRELTIYRGYMAGLEILNLFRYEHQYTVAETITTAKGLLNRALYYAEKPDTPNEEKIIRIFVVTFASTYQKLAAYDLEQAKLFARELVTNLTNETTPIGDVYEINPL